MSRTSIVPTAYATLDELERGFRHQLRLYQRARLEVSSAGETRDAQRLGLIHSQGILLQSMRAQILTRFPGDSRADQLCARVAEFAAVLEGQAGALRERLGESSRREVSRSVVDDCQRLRADLQRELGSGVGAVSESYARASCRLGKSRDPVRCEVAYLRLSDLRGSDGFVHPACYVAVAHPERGPRHVSVHRGYRVPGRLRWQSTARTQRDVLRRVREAIECPE